MQETADVLPLTDYSSQVRERGQDLAVIQESSAKSCSRVWIVCSDVVQNLPKVAQGRLGNDDFKCH